jgi:predicted SAM-dependent methyltransferase
MRINEPQILINLGCGTNPCDGWVNLDRSPGVLLRRFPGSARRALAALGVREALVEWPAAVQRVDATRGLPFGNGTVDAIYSSHMLEHLSARDGAIVLAECHRVLRSDGVLRLALPDLRSLADSYLASDDPEAADRFMDASLLGWPEQPTGLRRFVDRLSGARHRWMYDAASLQAHCLRLGFLATEEWSFREGRCPDLAQVEHRQDSVYVEAYLSGDFVRAAESRA